MKYKLLALILMAATINSCGAGSSQNAKAQTTENETKVLIKTSVGDITIKLYNETPQHRDNFIKLVNEHFYDSILFHRVIKDFMVQAGDPESKNAEKESSWAQEVPVTIYRPSSYTPSISTNAER